MSKSNSTKAENNSFTRDIISATRYYFGNRNALLALAAVALIGGLAFNWSWLVAIGLAPILLSTLPCLVMCIFGVCAMCGSSDKKQTLSPDANGKGSSSSVSDNVVSLNSCHKMTGNTASIAGEAENPNKAAGPR